MYSPEEKLNSFLYKWSDQAISVTAVISGINVTIVSLLLIYRYGFILTPDESDSVFLKYDVLFLVFVIIYFVRFLFTYQRIEHLKKTWLEASLNIFVLIHGVANYTLDFKITLYLLEAIEVSSPYAVYHDILSIYMVVLTGLEFIKITTKIANLDLNPAATFIFSFIILIGIGAAFLMLPAMTVGQSSMGFLNALFTAVSASCVTGLAVVDTGIYFTFKGQVVIMALIQLGGIGIVSFATFFATFMAKGVGLKHQSIIQDYLSSESLISAKGLLRKVVFLTLLIEFIGFILIYNSWDEELIFNSVGQKIFFSVFHAISAFCNAGFSLFGNGLFTNELSDNTPLFVHPGMDIKVSKMYFLHFIIAILIVFGGIGFSTIEDIFSKGRGNKSFFKPWREWKISTKIAIYSTAFLILLGLVAFMILEAHQLRDRTILEAISTSFFQSVTTRTAGFNTMDFGSLKAPTLILCMFLMFIGTAPGSTGGGIKSSTFYLIAVSAIANIKGLKRVEVVKRTIPNDLIQKAYSIFMFATSYNIIAMFFLTITEADNENITLIQLFFEQVSAFSTAGLSMGITSDLSAMGKVIIIISMYLGRVGTLTLALALSDKVASTSYRYPEGHVMVG